MSLVDARAAAVLVHGRDQGPGFMLDLARRLGRDDVAWLLPEAADGTWYPGHYGDLVARNEPWLGDAVDAVARAVDLAGNVGMPPERIVLAGFSQGACVAVELLRRTPRPFAGVAVLTGALMGTPAEIDAAPSPDLAGLHVLCSSSRHDDWIPLEDATTCADWLRAAGAEVTQAVTDEAEHHVSGAEAAALAALLPT